MRSRGILSTRGCNFKALSSTLRYAIDYRRGKACSLALRCPMANVRTRRLLRQHVVDTQPSDCRGQRLFHVCHVDHPVGKQFRISTRRVSCSLKGYVIGPFDTGSLERAVRGLGTGVINSYGFRVSTSCSGRATFSIAGPVALHTTVLSGGNDDVTSACLNC